MKIGYHQLVGGIGMKKYVIRILVALLVVGIGVQVISCSTGSSGGGGGGSSFIIASTAFTDGAAIPIAYCNTYATQSGTNGSNTSLPLAWSNVPSGAAGFAIKMVDSSASNYVHWMVVNLPSATSSLSAGDSSTTNNSMPSGCSEIINDVGNAGYDGPEPPAGSGAHSYAITIYALSSAIDASSVTKANFDTKVTAAGVLDSATIMGTFAQP